MQQAFWMLLKCCWLICVAGCLLYPKHDTFLFWDVFVSLPEKKPGSWLKNKQRFGIQHIFPGFWKGKNEDVPRSHINEAVKDDSFMKMEGILQAHRVAFIFRPGILILALLRCFSSKLNDYSKHVQFSNFLHLQSFFSTKFAFRPWHFGIVAWHKSIAISAPQVMGTIYQGKIGQVLGSRRLTKNWGRNDVVTSKNDQSAHRTSIHALSDFRI